MLLDTFERQVPERFQAIRLVNNHFNRETLARLICDIYAAVDELRRVELDPRVKSLFERYMAYLEKSCAYRHTLNDRSGWLVTYGTAVLNKLNVYRYGLADADPQDHETLRSQFNGQFAQTLDKLAKLQQRFVPGNPNYLGYIADVADGILHAVQTHPRVYGQTQSRSMFDHLERIDLKIARALDLDLTVTEDLLASIYEDMRRLDYAVRFHRTRGVRAH